LSKTVWQNIAPLKAKILVSLVVQDKLFTVDNSGKGTLESRNCVICSKHKEIALHFFINCLALKLIWDIFRETSRIRDKPSSLWSWWIVGEGRGFIVEVVFFGICL